MAKKHNAKWARRLGRRVRNEVARHTERDRQRAIYGRGPRQWRPTHDGWSAWPQEVIQVRRLWPPHPAAGR
jgi:nicotinamidase-related amidase